MKRTFLFTLLLAVIGVLPSCKKEPSKPTSQITFGDTTGMIVVEYDSTLFRYYNPYEQFYPNPYEVWDCSRCDTFVDLNNDGNPDIFFHLHYGEMWPHDDISNTEYFSISRNSESLIYGCINDNDNPSFLCDQATCDVYLHKDSTVLQKNDTTIIVIEHFYNYKPMAESDHYSHTFTMYNIIHQSNAGEQLTENKHFECIPRSIYTFPFSCEAYDRYSNDTIYYEAYYDIDKPSFNFPLDEEKYIGFRFRENDGKYKLGWIKIKLISQPDGTNRLKVFETAIQK